MVRVLGLGEGSLEEGKVRSAQGLLPQVQERLKEAETPPLVEAQQKRQAVVCSLLLAQLPHLAVFVMIGTQSAVSAGLHCRSNSKKHSTAFITGRYKGRLMQFKHFGIVTFCRKAIAQKHL